MGRVCVPNEGASFGLLETQGHVDAASGLLPDDEGLCGWISAMWELMSMSVSYPAVFGSHLPFESWFPGEVARAGPRTRRLREDLCDHLQSVGAHGRSAETSCRGCWADSEMRRAHSRRPTGWLTGIVAQGLKGRRTVVKEAVQKPVPLSYQSLSRSSYTLTRFLSVA